MRVAIYYAPGPDEHLARLGAEWLGRDAFGGESGDPAIALDRVASARRYGFHATIRAPFTPADGHDAADIDEALGAFCRTCEPVRIDRLELKRLGGFLALVPEAGSAGLVRLQHAVLEAFEPYRRPLTEDETRRRDPDRLTERQRAHLEAWGYPFVLEDFRFHMTLTDSLNGPDLAAIEALARRHFADVLGRPLLVDRLAMFEEAARGAPFTARRPHRFVGQ